MTTPPLDLTAERLTALRDIVNAATPGPWKQWNPSAGESHISIAHKVAWRSVESATPFADDAVIPHWADARHIAAFDPPTVLALLDRVAAAESSLARYIVDRTRFGDAMAANAVAPVVDAIMRELTADSAARAEAAEKKVAAVRELRNVWFRELENTEHLVPLEDVIDATDDALGGSA